MTTSTDPQAAALAVMTGLTGPGGPFELGRENVLGVPMTVFRNRARSLGDLLADSVRHGDRDYLVTAERRISYAEHAHAVAGPDAVLLAQHAGQ
jgi:hypothetical protein